ncbi:TPA: four-helix bundle copper-binding protein [Pseudomonas aeruginosa]|nr:four-helix bundle copper-binding protein [Pseudomonas aeruginosa]
MPHTKRLRRVIYCANPRQISRRATGDEPLERECAGACRRFVEACRPLLPA